MRSVLIEFEKRGVFYVGADVARTVDYLQNEFWLRRNFRFIRFDLLRHRLWPVDLILLRDVLVMLPPPESVEVLININNSGSRFLLATTFPETSWNPFSLEKYKHVSGWNWHYRINLELPPYNLGAPERVIHETKIATYYVVGLWRLPLWVDGPRQPVLLNASAHRSQHFDVR